MSVNRLLVYLLILTGTAACSSSYTSTEDGRAGVCLMVETLQRDLGHIDTGLEQLVARERNVDRIEHVVHEIDRAMTRIDVLPIVQDLRRVRGLPPLEDLAAIVEVGRLLRELDDVVLPQDLAPTYRKIRQVWRSAIEPVKAGNADACLYKSPTMFSGEQKFELYCTGFLPLSHLWQSQLDVVQARAEKLRQTGEDQGLQVASDALSYACAAATGTVSDIQTTGSMLDAPRHTITQSGAVDACWRSFYTFSAGDRAAYIKAAVAELALVDVQIRLVEHWCLTSSDTLSMAWSKALAR